MIYFWKGLKNNEFQSGKHEAATKDEAIFNLSKEGVIVTELISQDGEVEVEEKKKKSLFSRKPKISEDEILLITKKFSTMIQAGMAIVPALKMIKNQCENQGLLDILEDIVERVNAGIPLSKTLAMYPDHFDVIYISLVEAGEASGKLDIFLDKIALGLSKKIKILRDMKKALMYPMILLSVAIIVIVVMMIFVVPVFVEIFANAGVELPTPTKIVMNISEFVRSFYMLILVGLLFGGYQIFKKIYARNRELRLKVDYRKLKAPILGKLFENMILSRFSSVLANLVSGGVNLVEAMNISKNAVSNEYMQDKLDLVRKDIFSGRPFGGSLRATAAFPETLCGFVEVGEETGRLNDMLETISNYYEAEFDNAVENFSQLLEPIMIVFLGVAIGFILVSMYMPIFKMGTAV